ncbi:hypothetical protein HDU97_008998 [Phlyctochytrium planicorne]|nr:hypothetical protein HDU97_008998 [Phlyctochytrium planicorne]
MVSFTTLIASVAIIGTAANAAAVPKTEQRYIPRDLEKSAVLMKCIFTKDGVVTSEFSDTPEASTNGTFPTDFLGPNQIPGWTSFEEKKSYDFASGRTFFPILNSGSLDVAYNKTVGVARVNERVSESTVVGYEYDCVRDNGRLVFQGKYDQKHVECFAVHSCKFGNRAVA